MMIRFVFLAGVALTLSGCAVIGGFGGKKAAAPPPGGLATEFAPAVTVTPLGGSGATAASLDQTSAAEKAAALAAPAAGGEKLLGKSVAALGPPAEAGLWVQSLLIKEKGQGRVVAANGKSLSLELRPGTGGALLSLSAYQALGISLTELPEITIYGK